MKTSHHILAASLTLLFVGIAWLIFGLSRPSNFVIDSAYIKPQSEPRSHTTTFHNIAAQLGIDVEHQQLAGKLSSLVDSLGAAACIADFNQDGWQDFVFLAGRGHTRTFQRKSWWSRSGGVFLFENQRGDYFTQREIDLGDAKHFAMMACSVADLDADNDLDMVISGRGGIVVLWNDAQVFQPQWLVQAESYWASGLLTTDFDSDGLVDIYANGYIDYQSHKLHLEENAGIELSKGDFEARIYKPLPAKLLINEGERVFIDKAEEFHVAIAQGRSLNASLQSVPEGRVLSVANDMGSKSNRLRLSSKGKALAEGNSVEIEGLKTIQTIGNKQLLIASNGKVLANNTGQVTPTLAHSQNRFQPWHIAQIDSDLDNESEWLWPNGGLKPSSFSAYKPVGQPNQLLTSNRLQPLLSGQIAYSTRALLPIDIDNDGVEEILEVNNNGPLRLLKNTTQADHWLGVDLNAVYRKGDQLVRLSLQTNQRRLTKTLPSRAAFFSQFAPTAVFYLKADEQPQTLEYWLGDERFLVEEALSTNRYHRLQLSTQALSPEPSALEFQPDIWATRLRLIANRAADTAAVYDVLNALPAAQIVTLMKDKAIPLNNAYLPPLVRHVNDPQAKPLTVDYLKRLESQAVLAQLYSWLSQGLFICESSQLLEWFFAQEEILPNSKHQILPVLFEVLHSGNAEQQICALQAIGESEHQRSLQQVQNTLLDTKLTVRIAAVYALARLRDKRAAEQLAKMTLQQQEPSLSAALLVALDILDPESVNQHSTQIELNSLQTLQQRLSFYDALVGQAKQFRFWLSTESRRSRFDRDISDALDANVNAFNARYRALSKAIIDERFGHEVKASMLSRLAVNAPSFGDAIVKSHGTQRQSLIQRLSAWQSTGRLLPESAIPSSDIELSIQISNKESLAWQLFAVRQALKNQQWFTAIDKSQWPGACELIAKARLSYPNYIFLKTEEQKRWWRCVSHNAVRYTGTNELPFRLLLTHARDNMPEFYSEVISPAFQGLLCTTQCDYDNFSVLSDVMQTRLMSQLSVEQLKRSTLSDHSALSHAAWVELFGRGLAAPADIRSVLVGQSM